MMDYLSASEASVKWHVSLRQVQRLLAAGRIPSVKKFGRNWMIPADTQKPGDPRREKRLLESTLSADLLRLVEQAAEPLPTPDPDVILKRMDNERVRLQYEANLAYLRGDFAHTLRCFTQAEGDAAVRMYLYSAAIAAVISTGDYCTYTALEDYLKRCVKTYSGGAVAVMAELALATAAVSCIAPEMAPHWLKTGDFGTVVPPLRLYSMYLRAKYFQCTRRYESMLAVSQTALILSEPERGFSQTNLYLRLCCAMACHALERDDDAKRYLLESMREALPHGFITPFAETVTALGGLTEECLKREFPGSYNAVLGQWERTFTNWIAFHNQFTKDNITRILTLREYHIAQAVARHIPYAKVARQQGVSVGRLGNIMQEIYGKLFVTNRAELEKYIL